MFGPLTGASVNLARILGPDVVLSAAGGAVPWWQLAVYLIGPVVGGLAAAFLFGVVGRTSAQPTAVAERT